MDAFVWSDRANKTIVLVMTLVMLLLITITAARLIWVLASNTDFETATETRPRATSPSTSENRVDIAAIVDSHLFGERPAASPRDRLGHTASDTKSALVLRGVVFTTDIDNASAIIGSPDRGRERAYKLNSRLPDGAKLVEIHPDRVVLARGGRFETLRLKKPRSP